MTKRRLITARVSCLPVVHRRTLSGTLCLESWRKRRSDEVQSSSVYRTAYFISDKHWAYDVIETCGLSKSSDGHEVVIFHANPGDGVMMESLLESCDHKQIAWEPRKLYGDYLQSLTEAYGTKCAYCSSSFASDNQLKILDEVFPDDGTNDDSRFHAKIVGNVPEMYSFIPKLVQSFCGSSQFRLCRLGIIEPILIVTGLEYRLMTDTEHSWRKTRQSRPAVYGLFLRTELLKTVPLSAFNHEKLLTLKSTNFDYDRENLYIVRLSLRKDLDRVCSHENINGVMQLLNVINNMKSRRVIPAMEQLCPDIGITLLELGISMMDRVYDIPLNMWPEIYCAVTSSNQFTNSALYYIFQKKQDTGVPM